MMIPKYELPESEYGDTEDEKTENDPIQAQHNKND